MSEPLDFSRPLWQLYLVEELEGGRHALVNKTTKHSSTASPRSTSEP